MQYAALLRGINVGGNNMIKMIELKKAFEQCGFTKVQTYINSGNVLFESEQSPATIVDILEKELSKKFHYSAKIVLRSREELVAVINEVPAEWKKSHDLRCYVAFVKDHLTPSDVVKDIQVNDAVDAIKIGKHVIYMSTKLSGLTKSVFTKLIGKKVFQDITIRNYNTTKKIFSLMGVNN